MTYSKSSDFIVGLLDGFFLGLLISPAYFYFTGNPAFIQLFDQILSWLETNLGYSAHLFLIICLFYRIYWSKINYKLKTVSQKNWVDILHYEEVLTALAVIAMVIGVIWTALGMRSALAAIFSNDEMSMSDGGVLELLDQLINGGILTALTSTIVGASMGTLFRLFKIFFLNKRLNQYQIALEEK